MTSLALIIGCAPAASLDDDAPPVCPSDLPNDSACADAAPSYAGEIEPILSLHCGGCHYEGNLNSKQVLETYDDIDGSVSLIEKAVYRCEMPPANEPHLTTAARRTLLQWLVCGAPNN